VLVNCLFYCDALNVKLVFLPNFESLTDETADPSADRQLLIRRHPRQQVPAGVNTPMAGSGEATTFPPAYLLPPARSSQAVLSAWKVSSAIRGLPAETLICGILARLGTSDRESPLGLTQSGTQRARRV
jgi:hypothetical protein